MRSRSSPSRPVLFAKRGLCERFQRDVAALGWKRKGERVLLGLSGGRDSVVLLHLLLALGHRVVAAHLNHRLRGKESAADERFVRRLCRTWRAPLTVFRADVAAMSRRHKLSIEEAARIARYDFLGRVARQKNLRKIAVAHHEQDQAETVLLKIFQGVSRQRLRGMMMQRPFPILTRASPSLRRKMSRLQLVRPLLKASHAEMALYARQNRLAFREDSSNRDLRRPRNWIRRRLLPLIQRRLNRNVVKTLARLAG